jgi:hypothetical protein
VIIAAGISSQLLARIGTEPVIVLGTLIPAGGLYWLSRIPVDGSYVSDILPGLLIVAFGLGCVFTAATTAANAGVGNQRPVLAGDGLGHAGGERPLLRGEVSSATQIPASPPASRSN